MSGAVKHICSSVSEQLASLSSKRRSSSSGSSSSGASLEQLQVVLHLVTSPFFRPAVVDAQLVQMLAEFLLAVPAEGSDGTEASAAGSVAEFRNTLLHVLEALSQVGCKCSLTASSCSVHVLQLLAAQTWLILQMLVVMSS
jgi:hypothetical protein